MTKFDDAVQHDVELGLLDSGHLLNEIVQCGLHVTALNNILAPFRGGLSSVDIFTSGKFVILYSIGDVQLSIVRYTSQTSHIYSAPNNFIQAKISRGSAKCDFYCPSHAIRDSVFNENVTLNLESSKIIHDNSLVSKSVDSIIDLHDFSTSPIMFLRIAQKPIGDFEWAFDRLTFRAHSYSTIRLAESNICSLLDLMSAVNSPESTKHIEMFVNHELHFVRWKAIQAIGKCNGARGIELVKRALDDQHPHVRQAAQATLERESRP